MMLSNSHEDEIKSSTFFKRMQKYRELLERDIRTDERKKVIKKIKKEIENAKEYGTGKKQELFHYTGLFVILEKVQREG